MRPLDVPPRTKQAGKLLVTNLDMREDVASVLSGTRNAALNFIIPLLKVIDAVPTYADNDASRIGRRDQLRRISPDHLHFESHSPIH